MTNCDSHGFERGGFLKSREINAIASRSTHGPRSADPPPVSFLQVVHPVPTEEAEVAEASDFRFQGRTGLTCIKVPGGRRAVESGLYGRSRASRRLEAVTEAAGVWGEWNLWLL